MKNKFFKGLVASFALVVSGFANAGMINVGVIGDENGSDISSVVNYLNSFSQINVSGNFSQSASISNVNDLTSYDALFVWTNNSPSNPTNWGNLLKSYADLGGAIVLSTYGFSSSWNISGGILDSGYSPFTIAGRTSVSGNVVATNPLDSIFNNVDLNQMTFTNNSNYANPGLDAGAELLATDGNGVNMIARNQSGNIIGMNIWPRVQTNDNYWQLAANALLDVTGTPQDVTSVPEPSTLAMFTLALMCFASRKFAK